MGRTMIWSTDIIDYYVKPPAYHGAEMLASSYNGVGYYINSLGKFPKGFKGSYAVEETAKAVTKVYKFASKIREALNDINNFMTEGENSSYFTLKRDLNTFNSRLLKFKTASILELISGERPKDADITLTQVLSLGGVAAKDLYPDLDPYLKRYTDQEMVNELFAGLGSGACSYVDSTVNNYASLGTYVSALYDSRYEDDPNLRALKAAYGAQILDLSGVYDKAMQKFFDIDTNGRFYGAGKVIGGPTTGLVVNVFLLPNGAISTTYLVTSSATGAFNTTLINDVQGMGGIDRIDEEEARNIGNHAVLMGTVAGVSTGTTEAINNSYSFGRYTAGDLDEPVYTAIFVGSGPIAKNVAANTAVGLTTNITEQAINNMYIRDQFGEENDIDVREALIHGATQGTEAFVVSVYNMGVDEKKVTKNDITHDEEIKAQTAAKEVDEKAKEAIWSSDKPMPAKVSKRVMYGVSKNIHSYDIAEEVTKTYTGVITRAVEKSILNK